MNKTVLSLLVALPLTLGAQVLPTWTVVREMTIDGTAHSLKWGGWTRVDTAGRIYVEQSAFIYPEQSTQSLERTVAPESQGIRVFSPEGTLLRTFGGYGTGPGEWTGTIPNMGLVGDSLWVEFHNDRLAVFPINGKKPRTGSVPKVNVPKGARWGAASFKGRELRAVLPGGQLLVHLYQVEHPVAAALVYVPSKKPAVFVARPPTYDQWLRITRIATNGRRVNWCDIRLPFANLTTEDVADDGSAIVFVRAILDGDSAGFARVTMLRSTGDTVYSRRVPATLLPIPEQVRDSAYAPENLRGCFGGLHEAQGLARIAADSMKRVARPMYYPPVKTVDVGRDGWVLIGFASHAQEQEYFLLDPTGSPIARIVLPRGTTPVHLDRDHIWAVSQGDADNSKNIIRYRIVKG